MIECLRWKDPLFQRYIRQEGLSAAELASLHNHFNECQACYQRFLVPLKEDMAQTEAESNIESNNSKRDIFINQLVGFSMMSDTAARNKIIEDLIAEKEAKLFGTKLQSNTNIIKPVRAPKSLNMLLKIAAVLVAITLPLLSYLLIIKPHFTTSNIAKNKEVNLQLLIEQFEDANNQLNREPNDVEALYKRASSLHELFLFSEAEKDFQHLIETYPNSDKATLARQQLAEIKSHSTATVPAQPSLYQQLDQTSEAYLRALQANNKVDAINQFNKITAIAKQMQNTTGEQFGSDLMKFYSQLSPEVVSSLLQGRTLLNEIKATAGNMNYTENLAKAQQAKELFDKAGSICDSEKADLEIVKYLNKNRDYQQTPNIIAANLKQAEQLHHLIIQAEMQYDNGEHFTLFSKFDSARECIEKSVAIAKPLNAPEVLLIPVNELTVNYFFTNENEKSAIQSFIALQSANQLNDHLYPMQVSAIMGLSLFNLNHPELAERCLNYSIELSTQNKKEGYIAFSYSIMGIIKSEEHKFSDAEQSFLAAQKWTDAIKDEVARKFTLIGINGYYARGKALAGDYDNAIALYKQSLQLSAEVHDEQHLQQSQLHQGLGECLMAKGELKSAEDELSMSVELKNQADTHDEHSNTVLTFASSKKSGKAQLELVKCRLEQHECSSL